MVLRKYAGWNGPAYPDSGRVPGSPRSQLRRTGKRSRYQESIYWGNHFKHPVRIAEPEPPVSLNDIVLFEVFG